MKSNGYVGQLKGITQTKLGLSHCMRNQWPALIGYDLWTPDLTASPTTTVAEVEAARIRLKPHRAPGRDGMTTEAFKSLDCLSEIRVLLFSVMLRSAVYPTEWGIALIISLLVCSNPASLNTCHATEGFVFSATLRHGLATSWTPGQDRLLGRQRLHNSGVKAPLVTRRPLSCC
jgi:hypothetical protein